MLDFGGWEKSNKRQPVGGQTIVYRKIRGIWDEKSVIGVEFLPQLRSGFEESILPMKCHNESTCITNGFFAG